MDREKLLNLLGELPLEELANPRPADIYNFDRQWKAIFEENGSPPKVEEITRILRASSALQVYDGTLLNMGSGGATVQFRNLANWLIWRAAHTSPNRAIEDLEKSLGQDSSEVWDVVILDSLEVAQTFEITDNIFIMPLEDAPDTLYKFEIEKQASASQGLPGSLPPARCALALRRMLSPRFLIPGEINEGFQHGVPRDSPLYDLARCTTLIQDACPIPYIEYTQICDHVPCAQFSAWGAGKPPYDVVPGPGYRLFEKGAVEVNKNFELLRSVPQEDKPFFRMVLDRLNQAKRRHSLADKAIDLGMALESLLLRRESSQAQLTMAFRIRGAWLLGEDISSRKEIYGQLGKIYRHRSIAVHQGVLKPRTTEKQKKLVDDLERGIALCIDAIKKLMDIGYPADWNDIVLGGSLKE